MDQSSDITFTIDEAILFFKRNFFVIFLTFLCVIAAVTYITFSLDKKYASTSQIIVQLNKERAVQLDQNEFGGNDLSTLRSQIEIIKSPEVLQNVIQKLDVENNIPLLSEEMSKELKEFSAEEKDVFLKNFIKEMMDISLLTGTNIIEINITSVDPYFSANVANEIASQYIKYLKKTELKAIEVNNSIIAEQINQLREDMEKASIDLEEYRVKSGLLDGGKEDLTEGQLFNISQQITSLKVELSEKQARLNSAQRAIIKNSSAAYGAIFDVIQSPVIASLKQQLSLVQQEFSQAKTKYKSSHPLYIEIANKERKILNAIRIEARNIISSLSNEVRIIKNNLANLKRSRNETNAELLNKKGSMPRLRQYEQHANITENIFQLYSQRLEETTLSEKLVQENASIISMAQPNIKPVAPNKTLNILLGSIVGLVLGFIIALIRDFFDNGVVSTEDLGKIFQNDSKFFILSERKLKKIGYSFPSLSKLDSYSHLCDIAFSIKKKCVDNQKIFSLVSSFPEEGKTTISLILSQILGQSNLNVLLIDFDYRKRELTKRLTPSLGEQDLFNTSDTEEHIDEMLRTIKKPDDNRSFSFLPAGKNINNNIWKILETNSFKEALEKVASNYDVVLIDTAPILAVQEVRHILSLTDAIIFITRWRKTPRKAIEIAANLVKKTDIATVITVLNQVETKKINYYGGKNLDFYLDKYKNY